MSFRVLIVDDSHFFRQRLNEIISECDQLDVIGFAENGHEAIEKAKELNPDIITMDYEMPYLDGISAVREIMHFKPIPIVMFSSMTYEDARITLDALDAGAVDFIPKIFSDVSNSSKLLKKKIHDKLVLFAGHANPFKPKGLPVTSVDLHLQKPAHKTAAVDHCKQQRASTVALSHPLSHDTKLTLPVGKHTLPSPACEYTVNLKGKIKVLVIGASTGGPVAVADIIVNLPADFPVPVVVIQHMPPNFTKAFAERLNGNSVLQVKEAQTGDKVEPGYVLIAPGGKQLLFDQGGYSVKIINGDNRVNYKPCIDITFASASTMFNDRVLGVILTGMGNDGCEGARLLKKKGSHIWSQDKESCVVYGMPAVVVNENLSDAVFSIKNMVKQLISKL